MDSQEYEYYSAIENNELPKIRNLLENGFDINTKNANGENGLQSAIKQNKTKIALFLIESGINLLHTTNNRTAAHFAMDYNRQDIYTELLNKLDSHQTLSSILRAKQKNWISHEEVMEKYTGIKDNIDRSLFHYASFHGDWKIINELVDDASVDEKDAKGSSVLFLSKTSEIFNQLFEKSTSNKHNKDSFKPNPNISHFALSIMYSMLDNNDEFVDELDGINFNLVDENNKTLLHYAAQLNNCRLIRDLLKKGVSINSVDMDSYTPLHTALENKCDSAIEVLVKNKCDINIVDVFRRTPLMLALSTSNEMAAILLLRNNANIYIQDAYEQTALHIACLFNVVNAVDVILEKGGDVDAVDWRQRTPLHDASEANHLEVVRRLLKFKPNIGARDAMGRTAVDLAKRNKYYDMENLLKSLETNL